MSKPVYTLERMADYVDILAVEAEFFRRCDASGANERASASALFAPRGALIFGDETYEGTERIAQFLSRLEGVVQMSVNPLIEVRGDSATHSARGIVFKRAVDRSSVAFVTTCMYYDTLIKGRDGWLFQERKVDFDLTHAGVMEKLGLSNS